MPARHLLPALLLVDTVGALHTLLNTSPNCWPRFPLEVSPVWNQVRLMSPASWAASCASLLAVVGCLNLGSLLVRRHMAMRVQTRELLLYPFRSHQLTSECSLI